MPLAAAPPALPIPPVPPAPPAPCPGTPELNNASRAAWAKLAKEQEKKKKLDEIRGRGQRSAKLSKHPVNAVPKGGSQGTTTSLQNAVSHFMNAAKKAAKNAAQNTFSAPLNKPANPSQGATKSPAQILFTSFSNKASPLPMNLISPSGEIRGDFPTVRPRVEAS